VIAVDEAPAILSIADAIAADSYLGTPHVMRRGDVEAALARAALRLEGELASGGQDHFYLETQAALAIPGEDGAVEIHSSTQHPTEVQGATAEILGCDRSRIVVQVPRMGGGFGGKESQATHFAALAALAAVRLRATRQGLAQPRARHADDRQAPPVLVALPRRLRRPRPHHRASRSSPTPTAAGASTSPRRSSTARCSTSPTPTTSPTCASRAGPCAPTPPPTPRFAASAVRRACS
jgi:CO/xanthine dehydrogenase Mo-binding subunit